MPTYQVVIISKGVHIFVAGLIWAGVQIFAPDAMLKAVEWFFRAQDPYFYYVNKVSPVALSTLGFIISLYDLTSKKYVSYSGLGVFLNGVLAVLLSLILVM